MNLLIKIEQGVVLRLSLADIKQVKEIRQRFGIVRAGTAADHDRIVFLAVVRMQRDVRQIKHLQDIGITHLILDRNTKKIKIMDGILRFERKQRDMFPAHNVIQVRPGGKHALTPDVRPAVKHTVKDLHSQMRHANFIYVRKAHRKTDVYLIRIFINRIQLIAQIAGRLLNG